MPKLVMLKGLPASGKTTWAKQVLADFPGGWKRINKDDIRAQLDNGHWSRSNEKFVVSTHDLLIGHALAHGYNVIADSTHLAPSHEARLRNLARANKADFEVKTFDISLDEAIKRDLQRPVSVGEAVIRRMYRQYIRPIVPMVQNETLPKAICVDIDGTLADMGPCGRSPFDWERVGEDVVVQPVADLINRFQYTHKIILLSGRDGCCEQATHQWLGKHGIPYHLLLMRKPGDNRKDTIVKSELFDNCIAGNYYVSFMVDDRNCVVDMWREKGLTVFQVAEGDF